MVGKIIEKTYKYTVPTPNELFEIFKGKLSKATLPDSWSASAPWTTVILEIFNEIGANLGFMPTKEYLRLDQTWEIRHPDLSTIVLALEHENTDQVEDILDDELRKLLDVKALLKVLIFYPSVPAIALEGESTYPQIQKKIRSAKIRNPDEKYIIITPVYLRPDSLIEVSACLFDSDGNAEDLGSFQVKYASKD